MKQRNGLLGFVDRLLGQLLALLMLVMVISVAWQVLSRYLFVVPAAWTEELARFLLIWIGMLGAAYAYRHGSHIGLDLLPGRLQGEQKTRLIRLTHFVCLAFALTVMVLGGGALMSLTWELRQYSAAMGLPVAVVYAVIPASGLLICLYALAGMRDGDDHALAGHGDV
ncbi:MAG: TRAP transporter small permease [Woeseia sp.]